MTYDGDLADYLPAEDLTETDAFALARASRRRMCTCAAGCDRNALGDPNVFPPCECWCHD